MPPQIQGLVDFTEVGRGGFGVVYKATEARFGRAVAVKVIRGDVGIERNVIARFERECLALGSLSGHPNIVAVHDSGTAESGEHYLVMEFLGGGSMGQLLAASGPANPTDAATWGMALAGALETAHRSGIIHRDVKPDNILFSQYGAPKLVDFGIARMRSAYETRSGVVSATLSHAAPEIVAGAPVTASADVYSLSSVLFTILHGRSPFDRGPEDSLAPLIARIASATPPDLRADGVPDELAAVIERGLAKTPEERYPSAQALGEALREALRAISGRSVAVPLGEEAMVAEAAAVISEGPTTTEEETNVVPVVAASAPVAAAAEQPRSKRRRVVALLLVAALAAGGGAAVAFWPDSDRGGDQRLVGGETGSGSPTATTAKGDPTSKPTGRPSATTTPSGTPVDDPTADSTPDDQGTPGSGTPQLRLSVPASFSTDENVSRSGRVTVSPASADVTISNLPSGIRQSGKGYAGTVSAGATTGRKSYTGSFSKPFTVVVTARSGGQVVTKKFTWTVRDTHLVMPNYFGKFGDNDVAIPTSRLAALGTRTGGPCYEPSLANSKNSTIRGQSVSPNSPYRWGSRIVFKYGFNDRPSEPRC